jgi:hypothetical protein
VLQIYGWLDYVGKKGIKKYSKIIYFLRLGLILNCNGRRKNTVILGKDMVVKLGTSSNLKVE